MQRGYNNGGLMVKNAVQAGLDSANSVSRLQSQSQIRKSNEQSMGLREASEERGRKVVKQRDELHDLNVESVKTNAANQKEDRERAKSDRAKKENAQVEKQFITS